MSEMRLGTLNIWPPSVSTTVHRNPTFEVRTLGDLRLQVQLKNSDPESTWS